MMTDHAQTSPDYQQGDELLKRPLDLIVGVWLSSTNVTTLVQPKLHVVSSCIIGMASSSMEAEKMLAKREWSHHVCNVCEDTSQWAHFCVVHWSEAMD